MGAFGAALVAGAGTRTWLRPRNPPTGCAERGPRCLATDAAFGAPQSALIHADARWIPLPTAAFDTVVATFPSEYIADQRTLSEIRRVLRPSGELIVVLGAQLSGPLLYQQLIAAAYRMVLLAPPTPPTTHPVDLPIGQSPLVQALHQAGFIAEARWHPSDGGAVFLIRATRSIDNM
jgi:SAM-dependent methyltransferase